MIDSRGRTLTPCRRKVAEREVRLNRAKWVGQHKIRLRFDPFAYRYVRLRVLERDQHTCYWCGSFGDTMDHVIPWSKGGRTTMNNCICACEECNGARGDTPAEKFAVLRNVPPPRPDGAAPTRSPNVPLLAAAAGGEIAATEAAVEPAPRPRLRARPRPAEAPRQHILADLLDPHRVPCSVRLFY